MKFFRVQTSILDDPAFAALADEACVFRIMALAARTGNKIPNDASYLQRVLLTDRPVNINKMLSAGFLEHANESLNGASNGLVEPSVEIRSGAYESSLEEKRIEENRREEQTVVKEVYDHWLTARSKTDPRFKNRISDNRRRKIVARLREFSAAELKRAIDAVALDPWDDRPRHDDLTVIFRNEEQVQKFLALYDDPSVLDADERHRRWKAGLEERGLA